MGGGHIPSAGLPLVGGLLSYRGLPSFLARRIHLERREAGRESAGGGCPGYRTHQERASATYRYLSDVSTLAVHRLGVTWNTWCTKEPDHTL